MRSWIWIGAGILMLAVVAFVPNMVGKPSAAPTSAPTAAPDAHPAMPGGEMPSAMPGVPADGGASTMQGFAPGTARMVTVFRGFGWLSMHGEPQVTVKQAKAVLAVMQPLRHLETLPESQATAAAVKLEKLLTPAQKKALDARKQGQRGVAPQPQMPAGHPDTGKMPAGHPDVSKMPAGHPDISKMPAGHPDVGKMPAGHPDVSKMPAGHPDISKMPAGHPGTGKAPAKQPTMPGHPGHKSADQLTLPKDFNPLNEKHVTPQTAFIADMIHATFMALEVKASGK
jgi:hypothetical protein